MADEADVSNDAIARDLEISRKLVNLNPEHEATGVCLNCDTALLDGKRWCDSLCRDDYLDEVARRKNGR